MTRKTLLARRDLAAAGQELRSRSTFSGSISSCPSHVLLKLAQLAAGPDCGRARSIRASPYALRARTPSEKCGLYRWMHEAFDGVKPRLIHSWKREKEQACPGDRRKRIASPLRGMKVSSAQTRRQPARSQRRKRDDCRACRRVLHPRGIETGGCKRNAEGPGDEQAAQQVGRKKAGESGWDDQVGEGEQHARYTHRRGDHEGEGARRRPIPKKYAPSSRSGLLRMETTHRRARF